MKKVIGITAVILLVSLFYSCKKDATDNPTIGAAVQLRATLTSQLISGSVVSSGETGSFSGNLNASLTVLSYTVTYSGLTPTAITLDPTSSTLSSSSTSNYSNSVLLAGSYPTSLSTPGSGSSTIPGSGTSTAPGSGSGVSFSSPISGTVSVSSSRADSLRRGYYQVNIRTLANPTGELSGTVQAQ